MGKHKENVPLHIKKMLMEERKKIVWVNIDIYNIYMCVYIYIVDYPHKFFKHKFC